VSHLGLGWVIEHMPVRIVIMFLFMTYKEQNGTISSRYMKIEGSL